MVLVVLPFMVRSECFTVAGHVFSMVWTGAVVRLVCPAAEG
jgi:hypothetical protein